MKCSFETVWAAKVAARPKLAPHKGRFVEDQALGDVPAGLLAVGDVVVWPDGTERVVRGVTPNGPGEVLVDLNTPGEGEAISDDLERAALAACGRRDRLRD